MDAKNFRRDAGLTPYRIVHRKGGHARTAVVAGIVGLLILSGIIEIMSMDVKRTSVRHTITVDGNPNDWSGEMPGIGNSFLVSNGEYVWNDSTGDERNDFATPDERVDLTEFRVTGDNTYIYFMAKFKNMSGFYLGDNGATWMAIAIDNGTSGGETWFAGSSDTQVNSSAAWEYQVVVNLADSRYAGKNMVYALHPLNESTANWGSIFYVVNRSWNFQYFTGDTGAYGLMAVNLTLNTIEIKIAWSVIGLNPADSPTLQISVITARGYSDYASNQGNTWDSSGNSDALDCITTTGPNTWQEVQDGVVNDYATITFDSTGVTNGGFVPEMNLLLLSVAFLFIAAVILRRKD